jgi:hypothetical protein
MIILKRDDIKNILGENASEEQITNLLNAFHNSNNEQKKEYEELKEKYDNIATKVSDYDNMKAQLDEINRANMTEQEKLEEQKKEIANNLAKSRVIVNTAKAKDILAGLNVDDKIIEKLVDEDEQTTLNSVNALKTMLENQKATVEKQTRESLANIDLTPTMTNVNQAEQDVMTFEKFSQLSAAEQEKFINEHPEEFQNL